MLYIRRIIQYEIAGERQDTSEMQNLFFSTGEGDTIAQDSRCKSSLSHFLGLLALDISLFPFN